MYLFAIICALLLDYLLGEPPRYHPLVGFGKSALWIERRLNKHPESRYTIANGGIAMLILVMPCMLLAWLAGSLMGSIAWLLDITVLYWAIGLTSLQQHIKPIQRALQDQQTEQARHYLSRIVSRDTVDLSTEQITSATIESTLENGNDCLFAVLFCYLLGGVTLVVAYRLINTLDAMWGYRNPRYEYFGKVAAKLDDVLNYIPARLTAFSYSLCGDFRQAINSWQTYASMLASPNAGPVMAAGAGSLGLKLGGPTAYHKRMMDKPHYGGTKKTQIGDLQRANQLVVKSTIVWCSALLLFQLLISLPLITNLL